MLFISHLFLAKLIYSSLSVVSHETIDCLQKYIILNFNPFQITDVIFVSIVLRKDHSQSWLKMLVIVQRKKMHQDILSHWPTVFRSELQIFSSYYSCFTITYTCWKMTSKLIVLYIGNVFFFLSKFRVFSSLFSSLKTVCQEHYRFLEVCQWQLVQKLRSEEEFAARVDSINYRDGGWCEFFTMLRR